MAKLYKKINLFVFAVVVICFGATNDTTIDSATLKRIYMGNYSYNTCIASQPILSMRWASDLNRPVFKNRTGTLYKALMDASTTSNTPQYRVFFADANGLASSSSSFIYTNGNLHSDYFSGDSIVVTGKLKGATGDYSGNIQATGSVTASDLRASDSVTGTHGYFVWGISTPGDVNATGDIYGRVGTFIASVSGTDLKASDSIVGVTGTFSSALSSTTLNTGYGNNELYPMDQDLRKIASPIFNSGTFTAIGVGTSKPVGRIEATVPEYTTMMALGDTLGIGLAVTARDTSGYGLYFGLNSTGDAWIQNGRTSGNTAYNMSLQAAGGNVTIGNTSSTHKLNVGGDGGFTQGVNATDFRASDSIKGVNASFSGRTTTTTLQASDTVKSSYGKFTNDLIVDGVRFNCISEVPYIFRDSLHNNIVIGARYTDPYTYDAGVVFSAVTYDSTLVTKADTVKIKKLVAASINTDTLKINNKKMDYDSGSFTVTTDAFVVDVNCTFKY
ncbi:MAG TPA: hypothetical protein VFM18_00165, partial [Methanosarcina sp.]|nr:hypothetical protein [Methanosarcina sp.]